MQLQLLLSPFCSVLATMPRITVEAQGTLVHCQPQQLHSVLQNLGLKTTGGDSNDVLSLSANAAKRCMEDFDHLKLSGAASRNFGTAMRTVATRASIADSSLRDTPLGKVLGWIAAAADAHRHLTAGVIAEATAMLHEIM